MDSSEVYFSMPTIMSSPWNRLPHRGLDLLPVNRESKKPPIDGGFIHFEGKVIFRLNREFLPGEYKSYKAGAQKKHG